MNNNDIGCVYQIKCLINNKLYFGQTIDIKRRKWEHLYFLKHNKHKNNYLQADFNVYGVDKFQFKILEEGLDKKHRIEMETYYINLNGGIESDNVYNYQDNISENKEMRNLVSKGQQGKIICKDSIEKMRKKLTGRNLSEEHKLHIKQSCKKFIGDANPAKRPEVREKISNAVSGSKNGMYGKHHTDKAREAIRQARLGKSPANKGVPMGEETKLKISNSLKGKSTWNKGKCKYPKEFIEDLRKEYNEYHSYKAVQRLHPEICYDVIRALIINGKTH